MRKTCRRVLPEFHVFASAGLTLPNSQPSAYLTPSHNPLPFNPFSDLTHNRALSYLPSSLPLV